MQKALELLHDFTLAQKLTHRILQQFDSGTHYNLPQARSNSQDLRTEIRRVQNIHE